MACEQFEERIPDYLEGRLPEAKRSELAAHLAGCAACREFAQQLKQLDAQLTRTVKVPALSPSFNAKLRHRIQIAGNLSPTEQLLRKRALTADYEAGLERLAFFSKRPRKFFETLGFAAMLGLAGWTLWLLGFQIFSSFNLTGGLAINQNLVLLLIAVAVPISLGMLMTFPKGNRSLWRLLLPAGGSSSATA